MLEKTITCIQDHLVQEARAYLENNDAAPRGASFMITHLPEVIEDFKDEHLQSLTQEVLDFWNREKSTFSEVESIPNDLYRECLEEIDFFDYEPDDDYEDDFNNPECGSRYHKLREGVSREKGEALEAEGEAVDKEYWRGEEDIEDHRVDELGDLERDLARLKLPKRKTVEHRLQELEVEYVYCANVGQLLDLVEKELELKCQSRQSQVNVPEAEKEVGRCPAIKRELFYKRAAEFFPV